MLRTLATLAVLAITLRSVPAAADVTEPNGLVVPRDRTDATQPDYDPGYIETPLRQFFVAQGETLNWRTDAHAEPAVFSPLCGFSARFVLNEAGWHLGLGWYNADPGATSPPAPSAIYVIVPANSPVGFTVTSDAIRTSPNYRGGLVGFALVGMQTHYSEQRWNVRCTSCTPPAPWITSVTYRSTRMPNAYYLAFEDDTVNATAFQNDGDFNDDVFLLTGLACMGEGVACDTGRPGVCAAGQTECNGAGGLTCRGETNPSSEVCDGLDNDCNGMPDDGNGLCSGQDICERGRCVPPCVEGSCFAGEICTDHGTCVAADCATITCPSGERCEAGRCRPPCEGVHCPAGQVCRVDRCVDPCAGVTCDGGRVCVGGACLTSCNCRPCAGALTCAASGLCVDPACASVSCGAGQTCQGGSCVELCTGVVCPPGETCQAGSCMTAQRDAGVPSDAASDGSSPRDGGPGTDAGGNARLDGGVDVLDGARPDGSGWAPRSEASCACRAAGTQSVASRSVGRGALAFALAALAMSRARRRRRSH